LRAFIDFKDFLGAFNGFKLVGKSSSFQEAFTVSKLY
jgi:hypothetical protein